MFSSFSTEYSEIWNNKSNNKKYNINTKINKNNIIYSNELVKDIKILKKCTSFESLNYNMDRINNEIDLKFLQINRSEMFNSALSMEGIGNIWKKIKDGLMFVVEKIISFFQFLAKKIWEWITAVLRKFGIKTKSETDKNSEIWKMRKNAKIYEWFEAEGTKLIDKFSTDAGSLKKLVEASIQETVSAVVLDTNISNPDERKMDFEYLYVVIDKLLSDQYGSDEEILGDLKNLSDIVKSPLTEWTRIKIRDRTLNNNLDSALKKAGGKGFSEKDKEISPENITERLLTHFGFEVRSTGRYEPKLVFKLLTLTNILDPKTSPYYWVLNDIERYKKKFEEETEEIKRAIQLLTKIYKKLKITDIWTEEDEINKRTYVNDLPDDLKAQGESKYQSSTNTMKMEMLKSCISYLSYLSRNVNVISTVKRDVVSNVIVWFSTYNKDVSSIMSKHRDELTEFDEKIEKGESV